MIYDKMSMNLEEMYDERDDLKCAVTLLKKASTCISRKKEDVHTLLAQLTNLIEKEEKALEVLIAENAPMNRIRRQCREGEKCK